MENSTKDVKPVNENAITVLGLDPGEMTGVGIISAGENKKMHLILSSTYARAELYQKLEDLIRNADVIVCEDFKIRPNNARKGSFDWSHMIPVQIIGAVHYETTRQEKPIHFPQPNLKPMGYAYLGKRYVKGQRNVHHLDALAHAAYYLVKNRYAVPNGSLQQSKTG